MSDAPGWLAVAYERLVDHLPAAGCTMGQLDDAAKRERVFRQSQHELREADRGTTRLLQGICRAGFEPGCFETFDPGAVIDYAVRRILEGAPPLLLDSIIDTPRALIDSLARSAKCVIARLEHGLERAVDMGLVGSFAFAGPDLLEFSYARTSVNERVLASSVSSEIKKRESADVLFRRTDTQTTISCRRDFETVVYLETHVHRLERPYFQGAPTRSVRVPKRIDALLRCIPRHLAPALSFALSTDFSKTTDRQEVSRSTHTRFDRRTFHRTRRNLNWESISRAASAAEGIVVGLASIPLGICSVVFSMGVDPGLLLGDRYCIAGWTPDEVR